MQRRKWRVWLEKAGVYNIFRITVCKDEFAGGVPTSGDVSRKGDDNLPCLARRLRPITLSM